MASNFQKTFQSIKTAVTNKVTSNNYAVLKPGLDNKPAQQLHLTAKQQYAQAEPLPIPPNIDPTETTRFSPQRARDISSSAILSHHVSSPNYIDITVDNSSDPHVGSYDCTGAVSLNSSMQSNVPSPFGGMHKFSHLNMPGGQWEQGNKFMSHDLQSSHYINLRRETRSNWSQYDKKMPVKATNVGEGIIFQGLQMTPLTKACARFLHASNQSSRSFSTAANPKSKENETNEKLISTLNPEKEKHLPLSRKDKLKKAMKEYGSTVIVFHVGISLISLGTCYVLVSSGLDVAAVFQYFGWENSTLISKLATGSTFVVAYALHKVFAPVRISITLGSTPFIVRYLRVRGFLKPAA